MQLGVITDPEKLHATRPWTYTPAGYEYGPDEPRVVFHLRPWTRSTQAIVEKRLKARHQGITMDAALKKLGTGDKKAEAYTRELADFLIVDWENVVYADDAPEADAKKGDPIPCTTSAKVFLFENVGLAVKIIEAAQGFATVQLEEEEKNSEG